MKEQERSRKAELKDETAKQKQLAKERKKLEKHKFSEKDIVAMIDPKVLSGSVGGPLLTMFSQKDLRSEIFSSPFEKSIVLWIETPKDISQDIRAITSKTTQQTGAHQSATSTTSQQLTSTATQRTTQHNPANTAA
ncbi:crossover junction endonuclease EME1B-like isoform X2 [Chenopodium quinoa]|uniref:crossover junction endonuclease EME1B-like isoform X2 n=1 Tax=Chenopodium quinoa TaxID=63459 RepID=UPI000B77AADC|nr:crossover junction endonuclease EME1B-like isoform X2 [Chenopodium quinoa]